MAQRPRSAIHDGLKQGQNQCVVSQCTAYVPTGKSYCETHYKEALHIYEEELVQYKSDKAEWDSLSKEQQQQRNIVAEEKSLMQYCIGLAFLIGSVAGFASHSWLLFLAIWIGGSFLLVKVGFKYIGKFIRGFLYGIVAWIIFAILTKIFFTAPSYVYGLEAPIAIGLAFYAEKLNLFHASAEPKMPQRPSP